MNINCVDIYNGMGTPLKNIISSAAFCKKDNIDICNIIDNNSTIISKYVDINILKDLCGNLKDCKTTFCTKGNNDSNISISCDILRSLIHTSFQNKNIQDKIKKYVSFDITEDNYCDILSSLAKGDVNNLINFIKSTIQDKEKDFYNKHQIIIDKYLDRLKDPLKCLCPHIEDSPPPVPPLPHPDPSKNLDKPVYNNKLVLTTLLVLIALAIIPFFVVMIKLKPLGKKLLFLFVIVAIVFGITSLIVLINPFGLYKPIVKNSEDWIPIEGIFQGEENLYGVKVTTELQIDKKNNVIFNLLTCDGKGCPASDLIKNCKNKTIYISNVKTFYGYPLMGECVDELFQIKTLDGTPAVRGLWLLRDGMNIEVQIYLHIGITKNYTIDQVIRIPVKTKS